MFLSSECVVLGQIFVLGGWEGYGASNPPTDDFAEDPFVRVDVNWTSVWCFGCGSGLTIPWVIAYFPVD